MTKITLTRKDGSIDRSAHRKVAKLKGLAPHEFFGVVYGATECRCVVCGRHLTDALSVQKMVGPICSRKYYSDEPVVSSQTMAKVIGLVAALDGRVSTDAGSIDADVIDFLMANKKSSRAFANILLAWGSVNAAKAARHKVLAISPIFRVLGYGNLADRLEKDRTPHRIHNGVETFNLVIPVKDVWNFTRTCGWVKAPFTKDLTKGGRVRHLTFKKEVKPVVWALMCHSFKGKPLSIEGKGIVMIPEISDKDKALLEARDTRDKAYKAQGGLPKANGFMCRFEADPKNAKVLRVFCTPPWEATEAEAFVSVLRGLKGRRWEHAHKCWSVPVSKRDKVSAAAKTHFGLTV